MAIGCAGPSGGQRGEDEILGDIKTFLRKLRFRLFGAAAPLHSEDRSYLEGVIFPWLAARMDVSRILFTGTRLYTGHYPKFFPHHLFYTIDLDARNKPFGTPGRHVVGNVLELERHYPKAFFDCVILNGMIGWGVDGKEPAEEMLRQASLVLKPGGILIIGWNDVPERTPFALDSLQALAGFEPYTPDFLPPGSHRHLTPSRGRHTFDFYKKWV